MTAAPDQCPDDPDKTEPGICGCGVADSDNDGDGVADCNDACPNSIPGITVGPDGCLSCYGIESTDPEVCNAHGVCVDQDSCQCEVGFGGPDCAEILLNHCYGYLADDPAVCSGNGDCVALDQCQCADGFIGADCAEIEQYFCYGVSANDPNVCNGHGICLDTDSCACDEGFGGENCQQQFSCIDDCGPNGYCAATDYCDCHPGWVGVVPPLCSIEVETSCFGLPASGQFPHEVCSGNGQCIDTDRCACEPGFYGPMCEHGGAVSCFGESGNAACSGNGECVAEDTCRCAVGWHGDNCEVAFGDLECPEYFGRECNGNGECVFDYFDTDGRAIGTCDCDPQWSYDTTYCSTRSWVCHGTVRVYHETDQGDCVHGHCLYEDHCECEEGWMGDRCSMPDPGQWDVIRCDLILWNDPAVCGGIGTCIGTDQCECPDSVDYATDFGKTCAVRMCGGRDALDPLVCSGRGSCVDADDLADDFLSECECNGGFEGADCEIISN
ncbi:MAG: hypothetical protein GY701_01105 [Sulfitobacter sp.]|nr:hypothetical protein [Sulfitobacter sp.]